MKPGEELVIMDELKAGEEGEWIISLSVVASDLPQADRAFAKMSATGLDLSHDSVSQMVSKHKYDTDDSDTEEGEYFDDFTMIKVMRALDAAGINKYDIKMDIVNQILNAGILFRERR